MATRGGNFQRPFGLCLPLHLGQVGIMRQAIQIRLTRRRQLIFSHQVRADFAQGFADTDDSAVRERGFGSRSGREDQRMAGIVTGQRECQSAAYGS